MKYVSTRGIAPALGFSDEAVEKMVTAALEADPGICDTETLVRKSLSGGQK